MKAECRKSFKQKKRRRRRNIKSARCTSWPKWKTHLDIGSFTQKNDGPQ